ncbi:MAG: hypothetical protein A3G34_11355 [Candidatus Lindowbacteria bacterium RIFCSPLOWO2_12_FULL_62_27]|nr:MAG: hypothetical protein A3I06_16375 [Candidatus Lindowbacteria bacterium RIFCSPLOWO2_02_FULL_62_12]OGH60711.1 MAG: hypothetical protein A3G34_11355 [Candidatus Lindowbacteria bacterium RIFCSPLOWO2_12_FULL_62_27]
MIFDGDCGFCRRSIRIGRALDWFGRIWWRARLEPGVREEFPQLSDEETRNRMVSILPDGRTFGGFYAVRDILVRLPLTALPALLLYIPGVSIVGVPVYQWIARNRHRFGGRQDDQCAM